MSVVRDLYATGSYWYSSASRPHGADDAVELRLGRNGVTLRHLLCGQRARGIDVVTAGRLHVSCDQHYAWTLPLTF